MVSAVIILIADTRQRLKAINAKDLIRRTRAAKYLIVESKRINLA
jgi:hypothetical protein